MSAAGRFWLGYAALLALAILLAGCSTTPSTPSAAPRVGADCITTDGQAVRITGAMGGGWWWVRGDHAAPWMVAGHQLARCS